MNILTKRYKCFLGKDDSNKPIVIIDYAEGGEIIPTNLSKEVTHELSQDNITKQAQELTAINEKTKSLKARFMKPNEEGTIDLLYLA